MNQTKIFLAACVLWLAACGSVFAGSLNRAEALYLQGSYSESIEECAANITRNRERDKAYYLLGLNYLKINDTEKAREKLKIISDNFSDSQYLDAAKLAYADTYFIDRSEERRVGKECRSR